MAEQDVLEGQQRRLELEPGAEPLDVSQYTAWRQTTDGRVLEAIEIYGSYLMGQTAGLGDALNLPAVVAVIELEEIPKERCRDVVHQLLVVHNVYIGTIRAREKVSRGR